MSSGESLSRTKTRQRERRAPLIRNEGFSVVEAMREMVPASTTGRNCEEGESQSGSVEDEEERFSRCLAGTC